MNKLNILNECIHAFQGALVWGVFFVMMRTLSVVLVDRCNSDFSSIQHMMNAYTIPYMQN